MTPNAEDRSTMKETLHIGSVKDIRALNKSTKTNPGVPGRIVGKQEENNSITDDTGRTFDYTHYIGSDLSVDVPTTITSYKNTSGPAGLSSLSTGTSSQVSLRTEQSWVG